MFSVSNETTSSIRFFVSRGVNRELKDSVTQRSNLNFVSSVFDPIGLVTPYIVGARLLGEDI